MNRKIIIDIHSKGEYPACALSNFAEYEFFVDNVKCSSMEGFLQSLKFKNTRKQRQVCMLSGVLAKETTKYSFAQLKWRLTHTLYWNGVRINRFSDEYQQLLDRAYQALSENPEFQTALESSSEKEIVHSIGKKDIRKTVLTEYEFVSRLKVLQKDLYK